MNSEQDRHATTGEQDGETLHAHDEEEAEDSHSHEDKTEEDRRQRLEAIGKGILVAGAAIVAAFLGGRVPPWLQEKTEGRD